MILDIIAQFWYIWAFFLGFFVVRRKRFKGIEEKKDILVIGHRGACGYAHENSRESIEKAFLTGVDFIEVDVRITTDNIFILSHEDKIKTKDKQKISITKSDFNKIKKIVLKKNIKIVSLEEIIKIIPQKQKILLDLKVKGKEFDLISFIRKYNLVDRAWISSSYASSLRLLKILEPGITIGLSFPKDRFPMVVKLFLSPILAPLIILIKHTYPLYLGFLANYARADFIAVNFRFLLTKRLVIAAHKRNLLVLSFKVNTNKHIRRMIKLGVDGIISDYPDRVKEIINNK